MRVYFEVIMQAILFFPSIAFLFTIPYIIYNYRKFGSVLSLRISIIYSFILYLVCIYCLVILPLPTKAEIASISGYKMQIIPFMFVHDIIKESKIIITEPSSWFSLINNAALFQYLFNIIMMIPFGMYLKYYFRYDMRKIIALSFSISVFFELTQLTGLYFVYPGSYRIFDVDDLIANTLGGICGFFIIKPFERFLPTRDEIDNYSLKKGKVVSLFRREIALLFDVLISALFIILFSAMFSEINTVIQIILWWISFILQHIILKGETIGKRIARIKLVSITENDEIKWHQYVVRYMSLCIAIIFVPSVLIEIIDIFNICLKLNLAVTVVLKGVVIGGYLFFILYEVIMIMMHKLLFYEKLSATKNISTIK